MSLEGNIIKIWDNCSEISEKLKVSKTHIYDCCAGRSKTAYGYKWRYKNELADRKSN